MLYVDYRTVQMCIRDSFINALSGKVAGVTINASSAGAGAAARVVMRGTKLSLIHI